MPTITLYELGPTRSARVRWALLEAGLPFDSKGNSPDIIGSEELLELHPLGKLPAVQIDGQPLFESAAIVAAIADLAPEKKLIAQYIGRRKRRDYRAFFFAFLADLASSEQILKVMAEISKTKQRLN